MTSSPICIAAERPRCRDRLRWRSPRSLDLHHSYGRRPYPTGSGRRCTVVLGLWLQDIESLEAISQNDDTRRIFLKMSALSQAGRLPNFLAELAHDQELDDDTKDSLTELASDSSFLLAVEEYLRR